MAQNYYENRALTFYIFPHKKSIVEKVPNHEKNIRLMYDLHIVYYCTLEAESEYFVGALF
jgi:hypothetical protein